MTTSQQILDKLNEYGLDLVRNLDSRISEEIEAKELLNELFYMLLKKGYTEEIIINSFQAVAQGSLFENIAIASKGELNTLEYLRENNEGIFYLKNLRREVYFTDVFYYNAWNRYS